MVVYNEIEKAKKDGRLKMKIKTIEYMADAMGIEICGDLKRTPEHDRPNGEICYTDEAGKQFFIDDLNLMTVIDPCQKPVEKAVPVEKVRPYPIPSYAVNRKEKDFFGVPYQRAIRLDEFFRSERFPKWMREWKYNGLKTEEEYALCAVACKGSSKTELAKKAVDQISSKDLLFTVAIEAAEDETRRSVLNRFSDDRSFLYAVRSYRLNDWKYQKAREEASHLLEEAEQKQIYLLNEQAIVQKLLGSEITEAFREALEKVSSGDNLIKLLAAGFDKDRTKAIIARAQKCCLDKEFEQEAVRLILNGDLSGKEDSALHLIHDPALLFDVLKKGRTQDIQKAAESQIYDLYDRAESAGTELPPLTDEQQDQLSRFYESLHNMSYCFGRKLLSQEKLLSLFEKRLDQGLETDEMLYSMEQQTYPVDLLVKMFRAFGRRTQELAKSGLKSLTPEQLKNIIRNQNDIELLGYVYSVLTEKGEPTDDILPCLDAIVLPMIESAKTPDGYNHNGIFSVYLKLGRALATHYGFQTETNEWEDQDGETWERITLMFDGHSFDIS